MSLGHGAGIVRDGLVLHLDAANIRTSNYYEHDNIQANEIFEISSYPEYLDSVSEQIFTGYAFNYISQSSADTLGFTFGTEYVKGESDSLTACSGLMTFEEAVNFVHSIGARLPTVEEVANRVGSDSGCGYDSEYIWTCNAGNESGTTHYAMLGDLPSTLTCLDNNQTAYVRYVADVDIERTDPVKIIDPVIANILETIYSQELVYDISETNSPDMSSYSFINGAATDNSKRFILTNGALIENGYFSFDGTNDYITTLGDVVAGYNDYNDLDAISSNVWSVSVWFNWTDAPSTAAGNTGDTVIGMSGGIGTSATFTITCCTATDNFNNTELYKLITTSKGKNIIISPTAINDNIWHNAVVVWDGTYVNCYLDGEFQLQDTPGTASAQTYPLCIGSTVGGSSSFCFQGKIGVCKIYDRAITNDEVKQNFNALRGRYGI